MFYILGLGNLSCRESNRQLSTLRASRGCCSGGKESWPILSGSDHHQACRGSKVAVVHCAGIGFQEVGEHSLAAGCHGYRGGHRSRTMSFLILRTSSVNYCYCYHHVCCCGLISCQSLRPGEKATMGAGQPRDSCPTEGQGGCVVTPRRSWQCRRLGLLSVEDFPEPSRVEPGPLEPCRLH